jgi:hypothetical protein
MVATVAAYELEQLVPAARAAVAWANRLAPQYRHQAMAQLTRWDCRSIHGVCAWLLAVVIASSLAATSACVVSRPTVGLGVRVWGIHSARPRANSSGTPITCSVYPSLACPFGGAFGLCSPAPPLFR